MRVLFALDKDRRAILLVGGDKSGDWAGWYARNILNAGNLFDEHQAALAARQPVGKRRAPGQGGRSRNRGRK
jgi:hypothetical protein